MFWYGCPHCYALDPYLRELAQEQARYIDFVRVPVMWADVASRTCAAVLHPAGARQARRAAQQGIRRDPPAGRSAVRRGRSDRRRWQQQLKFAKANGISERISSRPTTRFGVQSDLQRPTIWTVATRSTGVPTIVIDGKYETDVGMAGGDAS